MATAAEIIDNALKKLGAIASGENASSAEQASALVSLNQLIESWSNENMLIFDDNEETFALTTSQSSYTMGSGGDFNTTWPIKITDARLKVTTSTPNYELNIDILELDEWKDITQKTTTSNIPMAIYVDYSYPLATIKVYPVPSSAESLILNSQKLITSFATAATSASLPPGWLRALEYNLAVEIASEYGLEPSMMVQKIALESKNSLKRKYKRTRILQNDMANLINSKPFNWLTGQ